MNQESLRHWQLIHEISLTEAASLVLGIDPASSNITPTDHARVKVYARAIADAVQRANLHAWQNAKLLDRLMLYSEENAEAIEAHKMVLDIWECSDSPEHFLPSNEIRHSLAAVFSDPENVPILLPVDPWYTATVYAGELNRWILENNLDSAYKFVDDQKVLVTTSQTNWHSQNAQSPLYESDVPDLEIVSRFSEEIDPGDKPLGTKERNVLLTILGVVCSEAKIDYRRHAKTAGLIRDTAAKMGVSIGETTIENHLKKIPDALASRMK